MAHWVRRCIPSRPTFLRLGSLCQEQGQLSSAANLPSFSNPAISDAGLHRNFTASNLAQSLVNQQLSVLSPTSTGGPITRTPVYAIFELGSKQYKVSAGDVVWVERLKMMDVGTQLALKRVHVLGSEAETFVGRPYVENASVTAVIEEQVQDAKVIIFKKRRRKHSRRLKGHRQMLTGLRITGVNGIMAPEGSAAEIVVG